MQVEYTAPPRGVLAPEAARPFLIAEFGHLCFRCGLEPNDERPTMDVDHIIPVARGGGNYYGNYQFLCGPCNSWKHTQIIDFRPGDPRKIDAGLLIIPNEERVRKLPQKPVPIIQTVIERVQVPIMIPVPPPAHDCYDALPRLFGEYTRSQEQIARLSERTGKAEAEAQERQLEQIRHICPYVGSDGVHFVPFLFICFMTLLATGTAIYFYVY